MMPIPGCSFSHGKEGFFPSSPLRGGRQDADAPNMGLFLGDSRRLAGDRFFSVWRLFEVEEKKDTVFLQNRFPFPPSFPAFQ